MSANKLILPSVAAITLCLVALLIGISQQRVKNGASPAFIPEGELVQLPVLLPKPEAKGFIVDENELQEALLGAAAGDLEYMEGLVDYYSRKGDEAKAGLWSDHSDRERKAKGLPSRIESMLQATSHTVQSKP